MAEGYVWPPRQQVAVGTADQAQPADSKWQSAAPTVNPRKISWIRRPWPLQFMAANGLRQNPRQHPGAGSACLPRTFVLRNYMNDLLFRAQT